MKRVYGAIASAIAIAAAAPAFGQTANGAVPAEAATADQGDLEVGDIVVTAQKRSERLQDVPISVSAIGQERLASTGVTQVMDLSFVTPSLTIQSGLGFVKPFIRGIGATGNGAGIEAPVAIYIDNVYIANGPGGLFSFNNIERIEVLKGPQGTLFGRNATGGLINVITRDPGQNLEVEGSASYGNYDYQDANLYVAGGLTESLAAGVAVQFRRQGDGWGKNLLTGREVYNTPHDFSTRGKVLLDLGNTEVRIAADYTDRDTTNANLGPAPGTRPVFGPALITQETFDVSLDTDVTSHYKGGGVSGRINTSFGNVELVSTTAYRTSRYEYGLDFDLSPTQALAVAPPAIQRDRQFSQELQLQGEQSGSYNWVLGAFYFDANSRLEHNLDFSGPLSAGGNDRIINRGAQTTRSYALYAQGTYQLGEDTRLTGGFRYTWDTRGITGARTLYTTSGAQISLPFRNGEKATFKQPTWRISLDHKLNPDVLVYASYNRGFKSGGFNLSVPSDAAYLPEKVDAYELGFKSMFAGRRIKLNGALFYYDYSNIQVARLVSGSIGIYNGARSRQYGLDLDGEFAVSRNLSITAGISALNSKFTSFPDAVVTTILPGGFPNQIGGQDVSGNWTPNAPKFTSSLGADLHFPTSIGEVGGTINWSYNDGFFTEADNNLRQAPYNMINMSLKWTSPSEKFWVQAWGRNLLGEYVAFQKQAANTGFSVGYEAPRTYGISAGFKF